MEKIISRNPRTGEVLQEIPRTKIEELPLIFERAQRAQRLWSHVSINARVKKLKNFKRIVARRSDELAHLIHLENGKPEFEALALEVFPSIDLTGYFCAIASDVLRDRTIQNYNPAIAYRKSILNYWPLGTVVVISPWNFPWHLSLGDIVPSLLAGNAVIFKPSEYSPGVGKKIQECFDEAGLPIDLIQTCFGEGDLGSALIDQHPAKVFFTGSVATGKKIAVQAGQALIPVSLELGGNDPMIVLPDADLDYATSVALYGGFVNSGQACAATERLLVPQAMAKDFIDLLKVKMAKLRPGIDLGVITSPKQALVYEDQLREAKSLNLDFYVGGDLSTDRTTLSPTLVGGAKIEGSKIYDDETFGPVIAVTEYRTQQEAIQKANQSRYGLTASVVTSNLSLGEEVARQLEVGSVLINEVLFTAGMPETPWGGVKESGIGRKHSVSGLLECVNVRHINRPRFSFLTFKSFWWFPYSPFQHELFRAWTKVFSKSGIEKLGQLPHVLWCLIKFLKNEPRL